MRKLLPKIILGLSAYIFIACLFIPVAFFLNMENYLGIWLLVLFILTAAISVYLHFRSEKLNRDREIKAFLEDSAALGQDNSLLKNNKIIQEYFKTQEAKDKLNLLKATAEQNHM